MADRVALASGNFTAAGSWGAGDATMRKVDGTTATQVTASNLDSGAFTPGAITVDGVLLNIASRVASPSGTMTVTLRNSTAGTNVTSVTINNADLPAVGTSAVAPGGWIFFKFSASQVLLGATNYVIRITSSVANQCQLYAGASNAWNLIMRTTTTGAPAAGERTFIQKEFTGAGTSNAITITQDNNNTTAFGQMNITAGGVLDWVYNSNTQLRLTGNLYVWGEGVYQKGTQANPIAAANTAILEFNCSSNGDYGLTVGHNATWTEWGDDKTYFKTLLAADAASSATSLTVADSIGTEWKNGDELCIASTTTTASQSEKKAMSADGSGTTLTVAALTNAHLGTAPKQAEIGNLTRNSKTRSVGAASAYVLIRGSAGTQTLRWAEFSNLGLATANKRGFENQATGGTFDMQYSTIHDCTVASSIGFFLNTSPCPTLTFSNNIVYNIYTNALNIANAMTGTWTMSNNLFMLNNSSGGSLVLLADVGGTFTNNTMVSCANSSSYGLSINETGVDSGTFSGNTAHSCALYGVRWNSSVTSGTLSSTTVWCNSRGITWTGNSAGYLGVVASPPVFDGITAFSNTNSNLEAETSNSIEHIFKNVVSNAGTVPACPVGLNLNTAAGIHILTFINASFGETTTHSTGDINVAVATNPCPQIYFYNSVLGSATEVANKGRMSLSGFIRSSRHDEVSGAYKAWFKYGTVERDTSVYNLASPSEKMTPNIADAKLKSALKSVALNDGQVATVSVYIKKDATYNGNQPRLMVKQNDSAGITSDTALATYSAGTGSWNQILGTTSAVTENCVLEFYVDCDGTAGFLNADDWACFVA